MGAGGIPRVNLLPRNELESRGRQALRQAWLKVFVTAFLLVAMAAVVGLSWTDRAHTELGAVARDATELQAELSRYAEGIAVRSEVKDLEGLRAQAGCNDLEWARLVTQVRSALAPGVRLVGFKLVPGAAPVAGADPRLAVGLAGTLTFSAASSSAQADTISRLREVEGFLSVDAGQLASNGRGHGFTFVTTFKADQTRYTGRFAQEGGK